MKKILRDLIFVSESKDEKKEEKFTSKFPESGTVTFPNASSTVMESAASPIPTAHIPLECAPHMDSVMKLYEDGFASLNKPGIDFYEFFEAVMDAGTDNPAAYKMALKMLSKLDKNMTPNSLLTQSQYYIDELTKVHAGYDSAGIKKKEELIQEKYMEGQKLGNEISNLRDQLQSLKNQLSAKEMQLAQIDGKYVPRITELDCKIAANNEAKSRILVTINAVINGIKTNL